MSLKKTGPVPLDVTVLLPLSALTVMVWAGRLQTKSALIVLLL